MTHIIVVTHLEEPKVYLAQDATFEVLLNSLRGDPQFCYKRSNVYALTPDMNPDHQPSTLQAIRLAKVGSTDTRHPAQSFFQEALTYAQATGDTNFKEFLANWKEMINRLQEMKESPTGT